MATFPALELVWTPTGTGLMVHRRILAIGDKQPITEAGLSFGVEGDVQLRHPSDVREFCRVDLRNGKPRLGHLLKRQVLPDKRHLPVVRREHHCIVNGQHVGEQNVELRHRDLIAMPRGPVFRVLEEPLVSVRSPSLERAIAATPGDRELLHVYGDFLLDHGDPLGARLAQARSTVTGDDAIWLDVLAGHYEAGALLVEWENGLAATVVLRESLRVFRRLDLALAHLLALPVMRFLRELTIDISSDKLTVANGLQAIAAVKLPETMRRLSFGDVPIEEREKVEPLLAASPRKIDVSYYTEGLLEIVRSSTHQAGDQLQVGDHLELGRTGFTSALNNNVLLGGSHLISRDGTRYLLARLDPVAELAKVNGVYVERVALRDGDLIEVEGELTARFKLVR